MDMLCQMDASHERGFLLVGNRAATPHEIARIVGGERRTVERLLKELEANGVFSRDDRNAIFSRRMTRECDISRRNAANGKLGGNPVLKKNKDLDKNSVKRPDKAEADTEADTEADKNPLPPKGDGSDGDLHFLAFWAAYPRKDDKGHARKAWAKAVKKTDPVVIVNGVRVYHFDHRPKFIPLPATWLNGERWAHDGSLPAAPDPWDWVNNLNGNASPIIDMEPNDELDFNATR